MSTREERHLIEVLIGPCSREKADDTAAAVQDLMKGWEDLGPAVSVLYDIDPDEADDLQHG